jgi:hypothetical protein
MTCHDGGSRDDDSGPKRCVEEREGNAEEYSDDEFGPEDDGGEVDEFMDELGYGEM